MKLLVTIDLANADLALFESYEANVLPLLPKHGARLEARVRTRDGLRETHLLYFPSPEAREGYLADPARLALRPDWERCGAVSSVSEVDDIGP
jgi:hypothetical protein